MKRIDVAYVLILNQSEDEVLMVHNADTKLCSLPFAHDFSAVTLMSLDHKKFLRLGGWISILLMST